MLILIQTSIFLMYCLCSFRSGYFCLVADLVTFALLPSEKIGSDAFPGSADIISCAAFQPTLLQLHSESWTGCLPNLPLPPSCVPLSPKHEFFHLFKKYVLDTHQNVGMRHTDLPKGTILQFLHCGMMIITRTLRREHLGLM